MNSLKGVNKQIIEINYTRDDYVQRAILIINPEKRNVSQSIINKKAEGYLNSLNVPQVPATPPKKNSTLLLSIIQATLYILIGATAAICILAIFN